MLRALVLLLASYAMGGVPVAYLAGRLLKGIDLRELGTGNLGPSNVWRSVSKPAVVPVGLAEIAQGAAGPLLAKRAGAGRPVQVLAGLSALCGHCWSPFLGFAGGRGIAHAIGFMLACCRPAVAVFTALALLGVALRKVPECVGLGIAAAPFVALAKREPPEVAAGMAGMAVIVAAKRLLTNDPAPPQGADLRSVLVNRLIYDRDTRDRAEWIQNEAPAVAATLP